MTNTSYMKNLYSRLGLFGFNQKFLRDCILPEWWEDSHADSASNRLIVEALICRQLGIDLASLQDVCSELKLQPSQQVKFKLPANSNPEAVKAAHVLGGRLAEIAVQSFAPPLLTNNLSAGSIRNKFLEEGANCISFDQIIAFCWGVGIPVLHLSHLPNKSRKPDGMALLAGGRPVIVIASRQPHAARHLFILAHELGHIVLGHLAPDSPYLFDTEIKTNPKEKEEIEANRFAVELVMGDPGMSFKPSSSYLSAQSLAEEATILGGKLKIDPGSIILDYSYFMNFYPVAGAALNLLYPNSDSIRKYRSHYTNLDLEELTDDNRRVFECLTQSAEA